MTKPPFRLIFLLLVIWALLIIRIGAPWFGVQEGARIWVHAGVKNYDRYGLEATGLMVVRDLGPADPDHFGYYTHHPPTVIWFPYLLTRFTGDNEVSIRFVFIAATMIAVSAFYVFVRRTYGARMAWWAAAFYGLVPMMSYYGRVPNHDPLGMPVVLMFAAILVNWLRQPTRARLIALSVLAWMAVWTAWTAVFFVAFLGFAAMTLGNRAQKLSIILWGVICVVAFAALMLFYQSQWDGSFESLLEVFGWRASNLSDDRNSEPFTVLQFVGVTLIHMGAFITVGVTALSLWGIDTVRKHGTRFANTLLIGLFLGGFVYQLVFRNASYVHDYYKLILLPAMAITAAAVVVTVRARRNWQRPIIDGLLLISLVTGGAWLAWLHSTGNQPTTQAIIDTLNAQTTQEDIIMTHLEGRDAVFPLAFYTFQNIIESQNFADAESRAASSTRRVFYIACPEVDDGFDKALSSDVTTFPAGTCTIALLP